jgi:hypothetical protein
MPGKKKEKILCLECSEKATWIRNTQFSGKHPYCDKHARLEDDFSKDGGSYHVWEKIKKSR